MKIYVMESEFTEQSLQDIVNKESASSEEVKQNDIAALRERIIQDKQLIESLNISLKKKKRTVVFLVVILILFVCAASTFAWYFWYENPNFFTAQEIISTETVTETVTQKDEILEKANNNDAPFQRLMGDRYFYASDGYPQDIQQAVYWWQKAAMNNDIKAILNLGDIYAKGENVEKDLKTAFKYYFQASSLGDAKGQYCVGKAYFRGEGVEKDIDKALLYLKKSAGQNYSPAKTFLNVLETTNDIPEKTSSTTNLSTVNNKDTVS